MSKAITKKAGKTVTTKYTYDGQGNRINVKVDNNGSVTSNTSYIADTESAYQDIIMVKDSVSGKTSTFTYADDLVSVENNGNISYYRVNDQHSVIDILDTTGKTDTTIVYDEYGNITEPEKVNTDGNIFAYTGHVYDEGTGLYYAKARYYDARCGRFVSEDSYKGYIEKIISLNQHIYVMNNPILFIDPSGYYSTKQGIQAHLQLQLFFKYVYIKTHPQYKGFTEYTIYSKIFHIKTRSGRVDIVLQSGIVFEIYEIKPFSQRKEGRIQLKNYHDAFVLNGKKVRYGITFNPNGLELVCPWNPKKVIKYYT